MPIKTVPLTDIRCRSAKAETDRNRKLFDGGGLFLEVRANGSKLWRLKYRHLGREKLLAFGAYPLVSLSEARELREGAKRLLAQGVDPSAHRQAAKQAGIEASTNTVEAVGREWHSQHKAKWVDSYSSKILLRLEKHVFPLVGRRPIAELGAADLLPLLRRLQERGALESAHRVRRYLSEILRYAISTNRAKHDVAADLRGAIPPAERRNFASISHPDELGKLLRAIDVYEGHPITRAALRLAPLLFCRPGELRGMRWAEIDLEKAEWRIPPSRQKIKKQAKISNRTPDFIVPLPRQAIAELQALRLEQGRSEFVFPSARNSTRSMSDGTINAALRRMGYTKEEVTGHGFRHTASTLLNEQQKWSPDAIERQLSHKDSTVRGVYNNARYMTERRKMMQAWGDYLDHLRGSNTDAA